MSLILKEGWLLRLSPLLFFFLLKRNHMDQKATGKKESNKGAEDCFSVCSRFLENNRVLLCCGKTGHLAGVLWQKSGPEGCRSLTLTNFQGNFS